MQLPYRCSRFLESRQLFKLHSYFPLWQELKTKVKAKREVTVELAADVSVLLNYYAVFDTWQVVIPRNAIIVSTYAYSKDTDPEKSRIFIKGGAAFCYSQVQIAHHFSRRQKITMASMVA